MKTKELETVSGFKIEMTNLLGKFVAYWEEHSRKDRIKYPKLMSIEDWKEQFNFFAGMDE